MKTKKKAKKNRTTHNNSTYTPGRNIFGQRAETHLVVLERETAFQQIMDCICQLDGSTKEFTLDCTNFNGHEDELDEITAKVKAILELKARLCHNEFFDCSDWLNGAA